MFSIDMFLFIVDNFNMLSLIITCALQFGMNSNDLKLFTSILVAGVLLLPKLTILKGEN